MNIINVTDLDNITDYDNTTTCNCTDSEYNIDIIIPALIIYNSMWSIIFMFNEFDGVYLNQTFIQ